MPTAIFCMNDEMAIAAMKGFIDKGYKVPEDISVTGFDDMEVSRYCSPTLTTVAQPAEKMGIKSAELLFELLDGQTPAITDYIYLMNLSSEKAVPSLNLNKKN